MQLRFLGKLSDHGDSPTLYATDQDSYVVQGYVVADAEVLAGLDIPAGDTVVEIYAGLFDFLVEDGGSGVVARRQAPIVQVTENGNYLVQGPRLPDGRDRNRLSIPDHEDAVELPKAALVALLDCAA